MKAHADVWAALGHQGCVCGVHPGPGKTPSTSCCVNPPRGVREAQRTRGRSREGLGDDSTPALVQPTRSTPDRPDEEGEPGSNGRQVVPLHFSPTPLSVPEQNFSLPPPRTRYCPSVLQRQMCTAGWSTESCVKGGRSGRWAGRCKLSGEGGIGL